MAALRRHGIAGAVAAALWTTAVDLRRRTRRRGIEHAATLDADTGQPAGPMLTGSATATNLSPHILSFQPDHEYVAMHTHPRNTSFSQYDVLIFAEHPAIRVMVAVGVDGTWHLLSRLPEANVTDPRALFDDSVNERRRLALGQTAAAAISHLAMEFVAGRHGLRYDQVMGSSDERPPS